MTTTTYRIETIAVATWTPLPDGAGIAGGFGWEDATDYAYALTQRQRVPARVVCEQTDLVSVTYTSPRAGQVLIGLRVWRSGRLHLTTRGVTEETLT